MSGLLPANTSDFEKAIVDSTDLLGKLGPDADLISRFKSAPNDPVLPFLIWEYGLGELQPYLGNPGTIIREGLRWQRLRGTPQALRLAFSWIGQELTIEEERWAHWASYQLGLPQIGDPEALQRILHLAKLSQPARCRLWRIYTKIVDRRPIVLSEGPILGDGWLSLYSGIPFEGSFEADSAGVLLSFGARHQVQAAPYTAQSKGGSIGNTLGFGFIAPYLDRFTVGRSQLSQSFQQNHGVAGCSLFSILWAERATTGRSWKGFWDARDWRDYTGFDRKLAQWNFRLRTHSRSQLVPSNDAVLSESNARLGVTFAQVINNPGRLGEIILSEHDSQRHQLRLYEMLSFGSSMQPQAVAPKAPQTASTTSHSQIYPSFSAERGLISLEGHAALQMAAVAAQAPQHGLRANITVLSTALNSKAAPALGIQAYLAPLWSGTWSGQHRSWTTARQISAY